MFPLLFQQPILFVVWVLAILIALSVHEFSHAWVSTLLGDDTAKRMGRLTLNPMSHVDLLGLLALVTIGFGWGKPVPYNAYNLRNQKWGPTVIALAGPGMNLFVALVLSLTLRLLLPGLGENNLLVQFLFLSVYLNVALLLFNLIPLPPLDGSKLLLTLLHGSSADRARHFLETRGPLILIGLVISDTLFNLGIFSGLFRLISGFISIILGV